MLRPELYVLPVKEFKPHKSVSPVRAKVELD